MGISRRKFISHTAIGSLAIPITKANMGPNFHEGKLAMNSQDTFTVLFLGTGAADWDVNAYPQEKEILISGAYRGQSSILINNSILVDCGATVAAALDIFGVHIDTITDIVITHTHADHFNIDSIKKIASKRENQKRINLWIEHHSASYYKTLEDDTGCTVKPVKCFEKFTINEFEITPVEANHFRAETEEQCLHYIFTKSNKSLFYALDGGWLTIKTWNLLKKMKLNTIIWDATWGSDVYYCIFSHNTIPAIHLMKKQMFKDQVLNQESKVIISHLSRNSHPSHANVTINMKTEQIITDNDGAEFLI